MILSLTPGNFGVSEGVIGFSENMLGIPLSTALSAAMLDRLISVIIAAIIVGILGGFLESIFGVTPPIVDLQSISVKE